MAAYTKRTYGKELRKMKTSNDFSAGKINLPSFAKIMIGDFESRMKIPPAFLKHIRGGYPRQFMLSRSARGFWAVHACKVGQKVYLNQGWKEFVQDNRLKEADFLIFHYRGDSSFHVTIFGRHCCLKYPDVVGEGSGVTGLDKDHGEIIDVDSDGSSEEEAGDSDHDSSEYDNSDNDYGRLSLARRKKWNGTEMRLTKKAARVRLPHKITQKTNFRIVMRKTYIRKRYLNIPVAMIGHLLGSEDEYINLMVEDKIWEVKLNVYEESYKLGAGWPAFVKENHLKVGDVCNFKVTKRDREVCLLVTIRRKDFCRFY